MLAFKIMDDPFVGTLTFARVYSGNDRIRHDRARIRPRTRRERIGRMLLMHANNREDIKEAYSGDIVALAGLKETRTGDTLCDLNKPVILERMEFPEPVIEIAIEPKSKADQEKLGVALSKLAAEDPSFRVSTDQESGQTILKGMGELHLDIKVDILRRTYKVDANIGAPQVAYREKLTRRVEKEYTHKKQTGGTGQFAQVVIVFEPNEPGAGSSFEIEDRRRRRSEGIHSRRRKGHQQRHGVGRSRRLPGRRCQGDADRRRLPRCRLVGARLRNRVARGVPRGAPQKGGSVLLEPIMKVEVTTPEDYTGSVMGDLLGRRGQVQGQDMRGNAVVINAMVPLANMFGYVNQLRSFSQGRANYTMQFDHYEQVPAGEAAKVQAKFA